MNYFQITCIKSSSCVNDYRKHEISSDEQFQVRMICITIMTLRLFITIKLQNEVEF